MQKKNRAKGFNHPGKIDIFAKVMLTIQFWILLQVLSDVSNDKMSRILYIFARPLLSNVDIKGPIPLWRHKRHHSLLHYEDNTICQVLLLPLILFTCKLSSLHVFTHWIKANYEALLVF